MPDMSVDFLPPSPYPVDMEARLAVLEHIAKTTVAALERLEQRQDQLLDRMDRRFDALDHKFQAVDRKFEAVDRKFEAMDRKLEAKFDTLASRHHADFLWLLAMNIATIGSLLAAMARGFHWL
ncbi:hypothetical protein [Rhodopila sp.]|uniref:hypothetical protein n=1 Tax=Rhodopila sp. TaxID=2480087 RepID=UPI003D14F4B5